MIYRQRVRPAHDAKVDVPFNTSLRREERAGSVLVWYGWMLGLGAHQPVSVARLGRMVEWLDWLR
jgi:hypothetical protein